MNQMVHSLRIVMRYKILFLLLWVYNFTFAQMQDYAYKRPLSGIQDQWHQVQLPNEIFKDIKQTVADIRIYGITSKNDTIEVPYLWTTNQAYTNSIDFKTINTSRTATGHFITFELPISKSINEIKLNFKETDFDWKVQLEGSQDQKKWFTIVEDYRIVALKNALEQYQFTTLNFPDVKYQYYRLYIPTQEDATLLKANISYQQKNTTPFIDYPIKASSTHIDKKRKTNQIDIQLNDPVPVSAIKVAIAEDYDYYRPITIQYAIDSIKTPKGWKSVYQYFGNGVLSSSKENEFLLPSKITNQIRVSIHNADNPPLTIANTIISGIPYLLAARFVEPANYFLVSGNQKAPRPTYDLKHYMDKIPNNIQSLVVGPVQKMPAATPTAPLFTNKAWLWAVMVLIIVILGGFTLKMLQND